MEADAKTLAELTDALQVLSSQTDPKYSSARNWVAGFRLNAPLNRRLAHLVLCLSNKDNEGVRTSAANEIFETIIQRNAFARDHFDAEYSKVSPEIRTALRTAALENMNSAESPVVRETMAQLLGVVLGEEVALKRELPGSTQILGDLITKGSESEDENVRHGLLCLLEALARHSLKPTDPVWSGKVFDVLLTATSWEKSKALQRQAIDIFAEVLPVFQRPLSFQARRTTFVERVFDLIKSDTYVERGYQMLSKLITFWYTEAVAYEPRVWALTKEELASGKPERKKHVCILWSDIAEAERKFLEEDPESEGAFTNPHFEELAEHLLEFIYTMNEKSVEPLNEARVFGLSEVGVLCLAHIMKLADEEKVAKILDSAMQGSKSEDWRRRYAAIAVVNGLVGNRVTTSESIMKYYDYLLGQASDPVTRVAEVAIWTMGSVLQQYPDILEDTDRASNLLEVMSKQLFVSEQIARRVCWLLDICFKAFGDLEVNVVSPESFISISDSLLKVSNDDGAIVQDHVFSALANLVACSLEIPPESYKKLFETLVTELAAMMDLPAEARHEKRGVSKVNGLLFVIQNVIIKDDSIMADSHERLMQLLVRETEEGDAVLQDVITTIGAVAREIGKTFGTYVPSVRPMICHCLSVDELVDPAAVLISDLYQNPSDFDKAMTAEFVEMLFQAYSRTDKSKVTCLLALASISKTSKESGEWMEKFLGLLICAAKAATSDVVSSEMLSNCNLIVDTLIEVLPALERIGKRQYVSRIFSIFPFYKGLAGRDQRILQNLIVLINVLAENFGTKVSVSLNSPDIVGLLQFGQQNSEISETATRTLNQIKTL